MKKLSIFLMLFAVMTSGAEIFGQGKSSESEKSRESQTTLRQDF